MRRHWLGIISALSLSTLSACAQPTTQLSDKFTEDIHRIKNLDPSIRPSRVKIIDTPGASTQCGAADQSSFTAFFCPDDQTIYTNNSTLQTIYDAYGRAGLRYLAAHELAHARQNAVTGYAKNLVWSSVLDELQADCIAGAYLRQAYGYTAEDPNGENVRDLAFKLGDKIFYSHNWHGNPRWRQAAVSRGLRQGSTTSCLSSKTFNYESLLERGNQWLKFLQKN